MVVLVKTYPPAMFLTHDEQQGMAAQCLLCYMRQGIHAKENERKLVLYDKHH